MSTYYVKPTGNNANSGTAVNAAWATPEYAAAHQSTGDTVIFFAGTYYMSAALTGAIWTNVTWRTAGDGDVVFSGGVVQAGFSVYSGSIYRAAISGTDKMKARNIYVDGKRYTRPRLGAGLSAGFSTNANPGYTTLDAFMATWGNKTDIELIYRYEWTETRVRVASISGNSITCNPSLTVFRAVATNWSTFGFTDAPTDIENAYEIFSSVLLPGSFYIDRANGYIYAIPLAGQDLTTATIVVPVLQQLLVADSIDSTTFGQGIVWSHTNYQLPSDDFVEYQENVYVPLGTTDVTVGTGALFPVIPAALQFTKTTNLSMTRNRLEHLGTPGLHLHDASQSNTITGCTFKDLSSAGYYIGTPSEYNPVTKTQTNTITNCVFRLPGQEFHGAPAGKSFYAKDNTITHNDVAITPYSGITDGWGWDSSVVVPSQRTGGAYQYNKIMGVMQEMRDGGGIYLNGKHSSVAVDHNLIGHVGSPFNDGSDSGLYPDQNTESITFGNNVVHSVKRWQHTNTNKNPGNTFSNNFADTSADTEDAGSTYGTLTVSDTPLAGSGITGYGLQAGYKDVGAAVLRDGYMIAGKRFEGIYSYMQNSSYTLPAEGTIMFWIKPRFVVGGGDYIETINVTSGVGMRFQFYSDGNCYFGIDYPYNRVVFNSATYFAKDRWTHVAYAWKDSPDSSELFINGVSISSGAKGASLGGISGITFAQSGAGFYYAVGGFSHFVIANSKLDATHVLNAVGGNFSGITKSLDLLFNGEDATQYDAVGNKAFVPAHNTFIEKPPTDAYAAYLAPLFDTAAPYARSACQTDATHITIYFEDVSNISDASLATNEFTLSAGTVTAAVLDGAAKTIVLTKSTTADVTSVAWTAASAGIADQSGNVLTSFSLTPFKTFVTSAPATTGAAALAAMI